MRFFYSLWFFILLLKVNQSAQQNAQKCSVINVADNILVIGDTEDSNYGNVLRFSCKFPTHALYGNAEIFCTDDGEWSNDPPECKGITCDRPQIQHGSVSGDAEIYNENEYLAFECNNGYKLAGERPSQCSKLGDRVQWSPTPACEAVSCTVTLVQGTQYDPPYRNTFTPGQTMTVTCDNNHWISNKQTSSVVTRCKNDGGWTIDPVCHEFTCSRPQDRSVYNFYPYGGEASKLGSTAWYSCKTGFRKLVKSGRATCTKAGWTPNPLCIVLQYCEDPPSLVNGDTVDISKPQYNNNEKVEYTCVRYYTMQGEPYMTCLNGEWRGEMRCLSPCTVSKATMNERNIQFRYSNTEKVYALHEDRITFMCKRGKTHDGQLPMRSVCNDGVVNLPRCV